jgi:LPXTG-motif cell wall-anchored protein
MLVFCSGTNVCAQNSKKVKDLKAQKTRLQKNLKKSQQDLVKTSKEKKSGESYLHHIDRQLEDRIEHIRSMEAEMDSIDNEMTTIRTNIKGLNAQLHEKKQRYIRAIRFSRQYPKVKNSLVFVLSAKSLTQMYRRARADELIGDPIVVKDGVVTVVGFDNGTYYLEETVAPEGFNKLEGRKEFTITDGNLDATFTGGIYSTGSGVHVVNKSGTMLPETGGMGTTLFITFGLLAVLGTGVLLVTKKRMGMIQD